MRLRKWLTVVSWVPLSQGGLGVLYLEIRYLVLTFLGVTLLRMAVGANPNPAKNSVVFYMFIFICHRQNLHFNGNGKYICTRNKCHSQEARPRIECIGLQHIWDGITVSHLRVTSAFFDERDPAAYPPTAQSYSRSLADGMPSVSIVSALHRASIRVIDHPLHFRCIRYSALMSSFETWPTAQTTQLKDPHRCLPSHAVANHSRSPHQKTGRSIFFTYFTYFTCCSLLLLTADSCP